MHRASPDRAALGRVLREFRMNAGHTQESLGYKSGLHRNYVGSVERGERNPAFEALEKWLGALGLTWEAFGKALDAEAASHR